MKPRKASAEGKSRMSSSARLSRCAASSFRAAAGSYPPCQHAVAVDECQRRTEPRRSRQRANDLLSSLGRRAIAVMRVSGF